MRPTAFSTWLAGQLGARRLSPDDAAALLSIHVSTMYDWLAGKDPRTPNVIQLGVAAALNGTARLSHADQPLGRSDAYEAAMSRLEDAQDRLSRIFFHYKPDSPEWKACEEVLRLADRVGQNGAVLTDKKSSPARTHASGQRRPVA